MLVVDTNVLAALLLDGPHTAAAQALYAVDSTWASDAFILIEWSNVLATQVRALRMPLKDAVALHAEGERRLHGWLTAPSHAEVLGLAQRYGTTTYDARYLAAAQHWGRRLITEDRRLRTAAPKLTQSLDEALAG